MARLTGATKESVESDLRASALSVAEDLNAVVVLKGAETLIATPYAEVFRYSEGDVGLATSGSGDVLAGILTGLLARGATLDQAAVWAVYLPAQQAIVSSGGLVRWDFWGGSCRRRCPAS